MFRGDTFGHYRLLGRAARSTGIERFRYKYCLWIGGGLIGYVKSKPLRNGQIISIDVLVVVMIIAVFHEKLIWPPVRAISKLKRHLLDLTLWTTVLWATTAIDRWRHICFSPLLSVKTDVAPSINRYIADQFVTYPAPQWVSQSLPLVWKLKTKERFKALPVVSRSWPWIMVHDHWSWNSHDWKIVEKCCAR